MFLEEIDKPLSLIKGLGVESIRSFSTMGVIDVASLISHFPFRYEDKLNIHLLQEAKLSGEPMAFVVKVLDYDYIRTGKEEVLKVIVCDASNDDNNNENYDESEATRAELICFGRSFLKDKFEIDKKYFVYGSFFEKYNTLQCGSFDFEIYSDNPKDFLKLSPIYHLSGSLKQGKVAKAIESAMLYLPNNLKSIIPQSFLADKNLPLNKKDVLKTIHQPANYEELKKAKTYLKCEEILAFQLVLQSHVKKSKESVRAIKELDTTLVAHLKNNLPFSLTSDQEQVIAEIKDDLQKPYPMRRLLQGDVGSGKTLVALCSALILIEQNFQVALLAPTELLAKQHALNAYYLLKNLEIGVDFLSSNVRFNGRKEVLERLKNGETGLVVGTHALFSDDVEYKNLALVVVDEQHRFGVDQRSKLLSKGRFVDMLLMSATPIPRTLALSSFGDLDLSIIKNMPIGRKPIKTHLANLNNEQKVYDFVRAELEDGHQAYFVYPLIEENEEKSLRSAEMMFNRLQKEIYSDYTVAFIHGKLDEESKTTTMQKFKTGSVNVLIATSVVEVGIDVPNATVMVIENAEQFGLSTLHQLRGRVGRSDLQSYCFLMYKDSLTDDAKARLKILYESSDGFELAEKDLMLRGSGEILGDKQSGGNQFKWLDVVNDEKAIVYFKNFVIKQFASGLTDEMKEYLEFYKKRLFAKH